MDRYLSASFRLIVNVESLNGVESIGNLSRHRTVPIVVTESGGYVIRYVPAISGESIAHAYQELLVKRAKEFGLPVGIYSSRGEFIKFTDNKILCEEGITPPKDAQDARRVEAEILLKDIICDVGGFLYTEKVPIKRTSRFQVGYMIPALDEVKSSALEAQFHVRHVPSKIEKGGSGEAIPQIPYNVEVGSAVYTITFNMDLREISKLSTLFGNEAIAEKELASQREKRIKAAMTAFVDLFSTMNYGAKRSRFLPLIDPLSAVIAISDDCSFTASPGNSRWYIGDTKRRCINYTEAMKKLGLERSISVLGFSKESTEETVEGIEQFDSIESLLNRVTSKFFSQ